jgi:hypothetical protein
MESGLCSEFERLREGPSGLKTKEIMRSHWDGRVEVMVVEADAWERQMNRLQPIEAPSSYRLCPIETEAAMHAGLRDSRLYAEMRPEREAQRARYTLKLAKATTGGCPCGMCKRDRARLRPEIRVRGAVELGLVLGVVLAFGVWIACLA